MNRQQFYEAILRYETDRKRSFKWSVAGLYAVLFVPLLVILVLPVESRPSRMIWRTVYVLALIAILVLYGYGVRVLSRRVATKHGMICPHCHSVLELRHIGFTAACQKCGTSAFTESNPLLQPTGQERAGG